MLGRHDHTPRLKGFARRLRKESTDAERKLWALLRGGQLTGYRFRRQHPIAGYIVDFVCLKANLVVELDGEQHAEPEAEEYDNERTRVLNERQLRVLRFSDHEVMNDSEAVARTILCDLERSGIRPSP